MPGPVLEGVFRLDTAQPLADMRTMRAEAVRTDAAFVSLGQTMDASMAKGAAASDRAAAANGKAAAAADASAASVRRSAGAQDALTAAVGRGTRAVDGHTAAHGRLSSALGRSGQGIQDVGAKASALGSTLARIGAPLAALGAGSVYLQMKFQAAMEQVHTQAGYSQRAVDSLSKSVIAAAPGLARTPAELAAGLYHIASVGIPAARAMDVLRAAAMGANISGASFDDTANALVTTLKNFPNTAGGAKGAMAELNAIVGRGNLHMQDLVTNLGKIVPSGKNFGLTLRDLGGALDEMTSHGMGAAQASTALRMTISRMGAPSAGAAKAFATIGLSSTQLASDMRGPNGMMTALADLKSHLDKTFPPGSGHSLSIEQQRADIATYTAQMEAAGLSGKKLSTAVKDYGLQLKNSGSAAVAASQVMSDAFGGGRTSAGIMLLEQNVGDLRKVYARLPEGKAALKQLQDAQDQWDKTTQGQVDHVKAALSSTGVEVGKSLVPIVVPALKEIGGMVTGMAHAFEGLPKPAKEVVLALAGISIVAMPLLKVFSGITTLVGGTLKMAGGLAALPGKLRRTSGELAAESAAPGMLGGSGSVLGRPGLVGGMRSGYGLPGSLVNPMVVTVTDPGGSPMMPSAAKASAEESAAAGIGAKESAALSSTAAKESAALEGETSAALGRFGGMGAALGGLGSKLAGFGGGLLHGAGIAGVGLMAGQMLSPLLKGLIGQGPTNVVKQAATGASIGAGVASVVPGVGTAAGAAAGGTLGAANALTGGAVMRAGKGALDAMNPLSLQGGSIGNILGDVVKFVPGLNVISGEIHGVWDAIFGGGPSGSEKRMQGLAKQIQALHGNLSQLTPTQLQALRSEAGKLAMDPSLSKYRGALTQLVQALGNPTVGLSGALKKVVPDFQYMQKGAGKSLGAIQLMTNFAVADIQKTLPAGSAAAGQALALNFSIAAQDVQKSMQAGVISTQQGTKAIFELMAKAFEALGIGAPTAVKLAEQGWTLPQVNTAIQSGSAAGFQGAVTTSTGSVITIAAKGGRLPGPARGDHIPLYSRGGGLMGVADGGELIVNRHTEARADSFLSAFGTRLSRLVANETTPHFATGGRIVTASDFGGPNDPSAYMHSTASGKIMDNSLVGYAELSNPPGSLNFSALGHLPMGTMLPVTYGGKTITIPKVDVGAGGSGLNGHVRALDLTQPAANQLNFPGLADVIVGNPAGLSLGAAAGAAAVQALTAPHVAGRGPIQALGQAVVNKITAQANTYLQAHAPAAPGGSAAGGAAPMSGPSAVQAMVAEADRITAQHYPYVFGGGHGSFNGPFDCSGAVSDVLHAAGLLSSPETTSGLKSFGQPGPGSAVTVYVENSSAGGGHTIMSLNGHLFGTSNGSGGEWLSGGNPASYSPIGHWEDVRHPPGLARGGRLDPAAYARAPTHLQDEIRRNYGRHDVSQPGMSLGGRVGWGGWHAAGGDMTVHRPTVIGVGDRGTEHVRITPRTPPTRSAAPSGVRSGSGSVTFQIRIGTIENHREGDIKTIIHDELIALANDIENEHDQVPQESDLAGFR